MALQVPGQAIRPSPLATDPLPVPLVAAVKRNFGVKVAVALTADPESVKVQALVPVQVPPLQPVKTEPAVGVAVSVTVVPLLMFALQVPGQLMPPTLLVTDPVPAPAVETVTARGAGAKFAPTVKAEFIVTEHAPVPEQAPDQPVNTDPALALSLTVTGVPFVYVNEHVVAQLVMFPSAVLIVPLPVLPLVVTVNAKFGEKAAPTFTGVVPTVKLQALVPEQAPVQPAKVEPDGVSLSVTVVPLLTFTVQVPVQPLKIVVVESETEPLPLTATVTGNWATLKAALTFCTWFIGTVQVVATPHPPPVKPANVEAAEEGVAVRVTAEPLR